jgi:hypothetical protein
MALHRLGKHGEALASHQTAKKILSEVFGETHPNLAATIGSIGNVFKSQGRFDEALTEFLSAHELLKKGLGGFHPDVASSKSVTLSMPKMITYGTYPLVSYCLFTRSQQYGPCLCQSGQV